MGFFRQVLVIAKKDLRAELRTKEAINASLAFALVILVLFSFAFDPTEETTVEISGGLLWIVYAFAAHAIAHWWRQEGSGRYPLTPTTTDPRLARRS